MRARGKLDSQQKEGKILPIRDVALGNGRELALGRGGAKKISRDRKGGVELNLGTRKRAS